MGFFTVLHMATVLHLSLVPVVIHAQEYVTVDTQEGTLRGQMSQTYTNRSMFKFEGIPYAEPPVDDLRFQPPVRKAAWSGVRDALHTGDHCPQYSKGKTSGEEDCLYLNVYGPGTPSQNGTQKAVIVWIHGGCFTGGAGTAGISEYFVDNDVIFVSINYRLGILGFLSTSDEVVPGNMGLKDQLETLRWVQRNIGAFGGDPEKVTILGQSAGGASIHYHLLSPQSKGLYKNAIAMSGSALNPWAFSRNATDRAIRFAKHWGYTGGSTTDLVNFLKTVNASTLVLDRNVALSEEDSVTLYSCVWAPSVEPEHEGAFLTEEPWVIMTEERYNHVPFLSGATDMERLRHTQKGGALSTEEQIQNFNDNFEEIVGCDLRLPTREEQLEAAHSIKEFYYNGSDITLKDNYTTVLFDTHECFVEGVDAVVQRMARYSSYPVFYYQFTFVGPLSVFPGGPGATHGDDVYYLFASSSLDPNSDGGIVRAQMTAMWANFAKYDNPTPQLDSLLTETWKEYDESSKNYLVITSPLSSGTNVYGPYMDFWHNLLPS
ncbi:esterase FE4-like isoform X2 [Schistocerca nitens]|uniref:esterase FE4-like isoform X2 n=1 Tax=Schistocerca nitens TaxID=7011 RepID=UPI002118E3FA|nr:esterase FE4-like isoform X2 [Schistocerca nitens]